MEFLIKPCSWKPIWTFAKKKKRQSLAMKTPRKKEREIYSACFFYPLNDSANKYYMTIRNMLYCFRNHNINHASKQKERKSGGEYYIRHILNMLLKRMCERNDNPSKWSFSKRGKIQKNYPADSEVCQIKYSIDPAPVLYVFIGILPKSRTKKDWGR